MASHAFTTTFEDLHGLKQLHGSGRTASDAAGLRLLRAKATGKPPPCFASRKVMSTGLQGGTSFMEDYTYHFEKGNDSVLGSPYAGSLPVDRRRRETDPRRSASRYWW
ncbi:hypothetical protein ACP0HM_29330 [Escherichia coli]